MPELIFPIIYAVLSLIVTFAGFGLMDEIAHHFDSIRIPFIKNNPNFWDKRLSWTNKWKRAEAFKGSSSYFVFLTDGWHLVQTLSYISLAKSVSWLIVAITDINHWWVVVLTVILYTGLTSIKALSMKTF